MRRISIPMIFYWAQVIVSVLMMLFGISYAIRCLIETIKSDDSRPGYVFVWLFSIMAYVGWKLMLKPSVDELRSARKKRKEVKR